MKKRSIMHACIITVVSLSLVCGFSCSSEDEDNSGAEKGSISKVNEKSVPDNEPPEITLFWLISSDCTSSPKISFDLKGNDNTGIAMWAVSESPALPPPSSPLWKKEKPGTFVLSAGDGTRDLFAWAKDRAGNVSAGASLTLELDSEAPVIELFDIRGTRSESDLTVKLDIKAKDKNENLYFLLQESPSRPGQHSRRWKNSTPDSYQLSASDGRKALYLWVMDEAGNMSTAGPIDLYYEGRTCTVKWDPNRERSVNSPGGGYIVYYSTLPEVPRDRALKKKIPYESGPLAPTETKLRLSSGTWYIKVRGFSSRRGETLGVMSDAIAVTVDN